MTFAHFWVCRMCNQPVGVEALAGVVGRRVQPFESRGKARRLIDQAKYESTLVEFVSAVANVAMEDRRWMVQRFDNAHLKRKDGPGKCLTSIRDGMLKAGLIEYRKGYVGRLSRVRGTGLFRALMVQHGLTPSHSQKPDDTTVLNNRGGGVPPHLLEQDQVVKRFNEMASARSLTFSGGEAPSGVYLVRKFKHDWTKGGRLFGGFWQELSGEERGKLLIDGEPVVELDFSAMQPQILFGMKGLPLDFDPYVNPDSGVNRKVGKEVYHRLANRKGTAKRGHTLNFSKPFPDHFSSRGEFRVFVKAMEVRLEPVSEFFGPDAWGVLQREESELLLAILEDCMDAELPAYPIHDSLIVRQSDAEKVRAIMLRNFRNRYGVDAQVS